MGLRDRFKKKPVEEQRYSLQEWLNEMSYLGNTYSYSPYGGSLEGDVEKVGAGFESYVRQGYQSNGVVWACETVRQMVFSEARFQWREIKKGRPGKLFGTPELRILEVPWPGCKTADLLSRMEQDVAFAGNAFIHRAADVLWRLRPDWTTIVWDGYPWNIGSYVAGYSYKPGGSSSDSPAVFLDVSTVAHYAPYPDPLSPGRGMSWLTPVLREVDADVAATKHKDSLFTKGGTPNMIIKADREVTKELFDATVKLIKEGHEGADKAGRWLFLQGGWDPVVVGANLQQLDFKATQGAGETRIAAAAGVHPVVVGLSEGMQGSSLNAGNFGSARRATSDKTFRPLWRNVCGSLERICNTSQTRAGTAELWYDDSDIAFLQEDKKDAAEILASQATSARQLTDAGYDPQSVVDAIESGDIGRLSHTGLYSVQLQEPGTSEPEQQELPLAVAPE